MTHRFDRRSMLRGSALVAAPIAALAAPAALSAADDSAARLAELEDLRAIEALHARLMRRLAMSGPAGARDLLPATAAQSLGPDCHRLSALAEDEPVARLMPDGRSAWLETRCRVERLVRYEGNSTVEKMARMQGNAAARIGDTRTLRSRFKRGAEGWEIAAMELA